LYVKGLGFGRIAGWLNENSAIPPRAEEWGSSTVRVILSNPFHAGLVRYGKLLEPGQHEPIWTPEEWSDLQVEYRRRSYTRGKAAMPYSGIVRCTTCEGVMTCSTVRKEKRVYQYYTCNAGAQRKVEKRAGYHRCRVRVEQVREAVLAEADRLHDPQELERACQDQAIEERVALQEARVELEMALDDLAAEVQRLLDAHTRWGHIQADVFDEAMSKAAVRQKEVESALAVIMARQDEMPDPEERARQLAEYATDVERWLDSGDIEEANAWLARRIRAIWCEGKEVVRVELV